MRRQAFKRHHLQRKRQCAWKHEQPAVPSTKQKGRVKAIPASIMPNGAATQVAINIPSATVFKVEPEESFYQQGCNTPTITQRRWQIRYPQGLTKLRWFVMGERDKVPRQASINQTKSITRLALASTTPKRSQDFNSDSNTDRNSVANASVEIKRFINPKIMP